MNEHPSNIQSSDGPPVPVVFSVDRSKAVVRGLWRVAVASGLAWLLIVWDVRWEILWRTQTATFIGLGTVYLSVGSVALGLAYIGLRWLALAGWPTELTIEIRADGIEFRLGPFGRSRYAMKDLSIRPDREIDADILEVMPDDAFVTSIRSRGDGRELSDVIQDFAGIETERLNAVLRPYLAWKAAEADAATSG